MRTKPFYSFVARLYDKKKQKKEYWCMKKYSIIDHLNFVLLIQFTLISKH